MDRPLVSQFHLCQASFRIRYLSKNREVGQIESIAKALVLDAGVPNAELGPDQVQYDGTCPTLVGLDGGPLLPFSLPITH